MSETVRHFMDLLADAGPVRCRRMFGGWGVFRDDTMFALVADEAVYLKADAVTAPCFIERNLPAFSYRRKGRQVSLSYYLAPDEALDSPRALAPWLELACAAAARSRQKTAPR